MDEKTTKIVLLTTPSLNHLENVSGVASVVRGIINALPRGKWEPKTIIIGKTDKLHLGPTWLFGQISVPFRFLAMLRRTRPTIVHVNGPLNSRAVIRDGLLIFLSKLYGSHTVYHIHGGAFVSKEPSNVALKLAIKFLLRTADRIICLGVSEVDAIGRLYSIQKSKLTVLPNSVPTPAEVPQKKREGRLRVLSLGRLASEKGLDVLCTCFEQDPELSGKVHLKMFGAGPLEDEVTLRMTAAMGSSFEFQGIAGPGERSAAYLWADVLVMPSLWGEGLPMVLLEAMAFGVVPIVTPDGAISEVVTHGSNGLIVSKASPRSLADALRLLSSDCERYKLPRMSMSAYETISGRYSLIVYAKELERFYDAAS